MGELPPTDTKRWAVRRKSRCGDRSAQGRNHARGSATPLPAFRGGVLLLATRVRDPWPSWFARVSGSAIS